MNKSEFLANLRAHLSVLPPEEQNELLEDYEAHFAFGLESGRTEEDIVLELGDPAELAKEAIGNRYVPREHVYWFGGAEPAAVPDAPAAYGNEGGVRRRSGFTNVMVYIGLFFLNIIVVPLLISFWAVAVSLAASAAAGIISPLLLGLEYIWHGDIFTAKIFASVAAVGLGILLAVVTRYVYKGLLRLSAAYLRWNVRVAKGDH
ncbi:HAAS signaling domain-containing protein [Paenibacillus timonensis]|uniref:HAAS signaling domain-containing protein n=1 Tax=Paenibacillus timonensis TaxID=225915 RepID=UPI003F94AD12